MQTLAVDDSGTELAYLDSGAPRSKDYVTIFAIHGTGFAACECAPGFASRRAPD